MNPNIPLVPRTARLLAGCLLAFPLAVAIAADPQPPAAGAAVSGDAAAKPYTLYVGTDISIEWQGQLRPVVGVIDKDFIVLVNGTPTVLKSHGADFKIRAEDVLKVTPNNATVSEYKAERAYTAANDPRIKSDQAANMAAASMGESDLLRGPMVAAQVFANQTAGNAATNTEPREQGRLDAMAASASAGAASATAAYESSVFNEQRESDVERDVAFKMQAELEAERFDAVSVTCNLSAPRPLAKPYVVVVMRYREKPDQPSTERNWIGVQELPRVDAKPVRCRLARGGFPRGFLLEDLQIHLYDQGVEVATNVARKRIGITTDEAFQFSILGYIEQHRGATLQPAPVKVKLPASLRQRLASEQLSRNFYVKVGRDGMPAGAFVDEACVEKLADADLVAAASVLRFNPALNQGKPVEGVAPVRLDQLTL